MDPEKPPQDGAKAGDIAAGTMSEEELSPEEDKRLLRKIDYCLLPVLAFSYLFQFLDKSALGFTAVMGLRSDLSLVGQQFSWASGIYYFGFLIASYPAGMIMVRYRIGKALAITVVLWGAMLMLTAVVSNAAGLLTVRFFLGVFEAPMAPALTTVVSMWYKRSEQPTRHAAWYLGNTVAGIVGGLMAYGIGHIDSIAPWKAVFLIFGAATLAWSVGIAFLIPDVPMTAWFLSKEDRVKAITRVKENMTGIKNDTYKWSQAKEAALDPKTWFIVVIHLCSNIANGGVNSFGSIVIEGLGFDTLPTLLLFGASYFSQLLFLLVATVGCTYIRNSRTYFMALNFGVSIAGCCMVRQLPAEMKWARYAGYFLILPYSANFPLYMAMATGNVSGFTKKMTVNAIAFVAYCVGNIVGPQLFLSEEAPSYITGFLATLICMACGVVASLLFRLYLARQNRLRDQAASSGEVEEVDGATMANLMDLTDKEIPQFRYVY